jgi:hypothetical protein
VGELKIHAKIFKANYCLLTQNCTMMSHNSGMVSVEKMTDQMRRPIARRVARPLIKIVADKKSTK